MRRINRSSQTSLSSSIALRRLRHLEASLPRRRPDTPRQARHTVLPHRELPERSRRWPWPFVLRRGHGLRVRCGSTRRLHSTSASTIATQKSIKHTFMIRGGEGYACWALFGKREGRTERSWEYICSIDQHRIAALAPSMWPSRSSWPGKHIHAREHQGPIIKGRRRTRTQLLSGRWDTDISHICGRRSTVTI